MGMLVSVFWPIRRNEAAGVIGRLGRLMHWAALVLAALVIVAAWSGAMADAANSAVFSAMGVAVAMLGRGVRYVLTAE